MLRRASKKAFSFPCESPILAHFKQRRILEQSSSPNIAAGAGESVYAGFDPTGSKLHLGNLLQVISLVRASTYGYKPIFLVGGATGRIGDPSGKSVERNLLDESVLESNKSSVMNHISSLQRSFHRTLSERSGLYQLCEPPSVLPLIIARKAS
jgi:tyrosyl-tRNA synthetase